MPLPFEDDPLLQKKYARFVLDMMPSETKNVEVVIEKLALTTSFSRAELVKVGIEIGSRLNYQ